VEDRQTQQMVPPDLVQVARPLLSPPAPPLVRAARGDKVHRRGLNALIVCLDAVACGVSVLLGLAVMGLGGLDQPALWVAALAVPALLLSCAVHGQYAGNGLRLIPSGMPVAVRVTRALPLATLAMVCAVIAVAGTGVLDAVLFALLILLPAIAVVPAVRTLVSLLGPARGLGHSQRVLIIGSGEAADSVASRLDRYGAIDVLGMVDDDPLPGFPTVGDVQDVPRLCRDLAVDTLIVVLPRAPWLRVSEVLQPLVGSVDIAVVPSFFELMTWRSGTADLAGMPLVPLVAAQRGWVARCAKRALDAVLAGLLLVLCAPVMLVTALVIRGTSEGPALFRQQRAGKDGQPFTIWKFRTMTQGADTQRQRLRSGRGTAGLFKLADDPRVTKVGAFLRRFSLDELPQLINVLTGDMSLVGPRPFPVDEAGALHVGAAAARFEVAPGMTGLWQVSGRSDLSWDDLCRLDAVYVGSWSFLWDVRILLQTPAAVLRRSGAY